MATKLMGMNNNSNDRQLGAAVVAVLRGERAAQRITYDELSERSGLDRSTVLRMLNNQRDLKMSQLSALCSALKLSVVDVMRQAQARMDR